MASMIRSMPRTGAAATALFVLLVLTNPLAQASPLTFVESTDLGNTNTSGPMLGSFDIGMNTVSGSILALAGADRGGSDYGDYWEADLLTGQQITGIDIVLTNMVGNMRAFAGDNVVGCCADDQYTARAYAEASVDGTYPLMTSDPFGGIFTTGSYPFAAGHYYFGTLVPGVNAASYSYEWRITVANAAVPTVPVPTTLALLVIGIAGIGFKRRKQVKAL